jgi:hypothetical protein
MWEQQVPAISRKGGLSSGQDGKEMILECADGLLGGIAVMDMWWHELEFAVIGGDCTLKGGTGFVIHEM